MIFRKTFSTYQGCISRKRRWWKLPLGGWSWCQQSLSCFGESFLTLFDLFNHSDLNWYVQNHLICIVPPYTNQNISSPVKCEVQLITQYKDQLRYSPTKEFTYLPNNNALKQECQSDEVTYLTSSDLIQPGLTWKFRFIIIFHR